MEQRCKHATLDHPLFTVLLKEHRLIASLLEQIDPCNNKKDLNSLAQNIWNFAELWHHYKEETLLFQTIYLKPRLREGGPMCTLFFDFYSSERTREKVETITQHPLSEESHQIELLKTSSPLHIPLEEHRSGKDLLHFILQSFSMADFETLKAYMRLYKKIQSDHFNKEENCFYPMCSQFLTTMEADLILEKWQEGSMI